MRVFKSRSFERFARSEGIGDAALAKAIRDAGKGLIDADLGGGLIKLRLARKGGGKSGGFRTLIAYRTKVRAVFLFGFAKSERANVSAAQIADLKQVAAEILLRNEALMSAEVAERRLLEVSYDEDK